MKHFKHISMTLLLCMCVQLSLLVLQEQTEQGKKAVAVCWHAAAKGRRASLWLMLMISEYTEMGTSEGLARTECPTHSYHPPTHTVSLIVLAHSPL